jgi:putative addiction module component (TIGR02574 family)
MTARDAILQEALGLSPDDRTQLIEELVRSLDPSGQEAIDAAIAAEMEDRINAFDHGELSAISWEDWKRQRHHA